MSELKPCPFCGEKATLDYSVLPNRKHWFITCDCCGMMYQYTLSQRKYVKDGWNTRPIEDALNARIAELEAERRWIPVSERLPDGGHREFYEVACIYQDFGELALFSKGRWVIYEGENVYDVTKRVKFWRKRQYLPDEVIAVLSKGEMNPEVQE